MMEMEYLSALQGEAVTNNYVIFCFKRVRKIEKSYYHFRHVCPSFCRSFRPYVRLEQLGCCSTDLYEIS